MIPSGYQTRGTMPPTLLRGGGARAQNAVEDLNRGGPAKLGAGRLSGRRYSCTGAAPWDQTISAAGGTSPFAGEHRYL